MNRNSESLAVRGVEGALEPRFMDAVEQVLQLECDVNHRPDESRFKQAISALQKSVRRFQFASMDPLIVAAREVVDKSWRLDESLHNATRASWRDFMLGMRRLDAIAIANGEEVAA